jgi:hypothetical protein
MIRDFFVAAISTYEISKAPRGDDAKLINTPRGAVNSKMSIVVLQAYYGGGSHVALLCGWWWMMAKDMFYV